MAVYQSTGEFYAIKLKHLPREWVEQTNEELGKLEGTAIIHAQFSGGQHVWTDWTKRIFGRRKRT